jgi:hypothetical protein
MCKTTIVALARKLLVALWKYSTSGVVIEGAATKTIGAQRLQHNPSNPQDLIISPDGSRRSEPSTGLA